MPQLLQTSQYCCSIFAQSRASHLLVEMPSSFPLFDLLRHVVEVHTKAYAMITQEFCFDVVAAMDIASKRPNLHNNSYMEIIASSEILEKSSNIENNFLEKSEINYVKIRIIFNISGYLNINKNMKVLPTTVTHIEEGFDGHLQDSRLNQFQFRSVSTSNLLSLVSGI